MHYNEWMPNLVGFVCSVQCFIALILFDYKRKVKVIVSGFSFDLLILCCEERWLQVIFQLVEPIKHIFYTLPVPANEALCGKINFKLQAKNVK